MNPHSIPYYNILSDSDVSINKNFPGNARARINYRGGIPVRLEIWSVMKNNHCARKGKIRIFRTQDGEISAGDLDVFANINGRSSRRLHSRRVARVGEKCNLSGLRLI